MKCSNCKHSHIAENASLECRRFPPVAFPVPVQTLSGQGIGKASMWPPVQADQSCGEYAPDSEEMTSGIWSGKNGN